MNLFENIVRDKAFAQIKNLRKDEFYGRIMFSVQVQKATQINFSL